MHCGNCGNKVNENAIGCIKCGANPRISTGFCCNCGASVAPNAVICVSCGVALNKSKSASGNYGKSRLLIGLMGIFFGSLGVHNFILGYNGKAVTQLLITLLGAWLFGLGPLAMWIWALVESIQILTKKVNEDAKGIPLVD